MATTLTAQQLVPNQLATDDRLLDNIERAVITNLYAQLIRPPEQLQSLRLEVAARFAWYVITGVDGEHEKHWSRGQEVPTTATLVCRGALTYSDLDAAA